MEGFLVVTQRPEKVVGQNKGFSPPFDIFCPLVKATFQQFGTFLLMLMLLTRNSISFHFVLPPSRRERGGQHRSKPTTQLCPAAQADNLWMERLRKYWKKSICSSWRREYGNGLEIEYGWRNWDRWGFMGRHWLDRIIGIFLLKSMSFLRQACKKGPYSHKPPYLFT